ncbi:hypothetical protein [Roseimicrobium gellanilyticum]|uniref:hypothetical protein n=1 Tax=Roseimicrobium gellanilyticum TaxID=748857 RepID=UPI001B87DA85|nr:hypothetical protein [Roseimicrobium gellanilyticum]
MNAVLDMPNICPATSASGASGAIACAMCSVRPAGVSEHHSLGSPQGLRIPIQLTLHLHGLTFDATKEALNIAG